MDLNLCKFEKVIFNNNRSVIGLGWEWREAWNTNRLEENFSDVEILANLIVMIILYTYVKTNQIVKEVQIIQKLLTILYRASTVIYFFSIVYDLIKSCCFTANPHNLLVLYNYNNCSFSKLTWLSMVKIQCSRLYLCSPISSVSLSGKIIHSYPIELRSSHISWCGQWNVSRSNVYHFNAETLKIVLAVLW